MVSMDVTVAERGQIVIPKEARDAMGLKPGAKLHLRMEGGRLWIEKKVSLDLSRWIGAAQDDGLRTIPSKLPAQAPRNSSSQEALVDTAALSVPSQC